MKARTTWMLAGMAAVVAGMLFQGVARTTAADKAEDAPPSKVAKFMRAKLGSSQSVLEGLVVDDFKLIEEGAQKMKVMSLAADWQVIEGPAYAQYSSEFRASAERLAKMAKEKNIDGAALSYMHLTLTCISCHKFVRGVQVAGGETPAPGLLRALEQDRKLLAGNR